MEKLLVGRVEKYVGKLLELPMGQIIALTYRFHDALSISY
jgi:flagellar motor switch/type III secretory pathway protein FliN